MTRPASAAPKRPRRVPSRTCRDAAVSSAPASDLLPKPRKITLRLGSHADWDAAPNGWRFYDLNGREIPVRRRRGVRVIP